MKPIYVVLIVVVVLGLLFLIVKSQEQKTTKKMVFVLPTTHYPPAFGPSYWNAIHSLVKEVPCPTCRDYAERFTVFFHDTVNYKLGKPLYDKENFNYFLDLFSKVRDGKNPFLKPVEDNAVH